MTGGQSKQMTVVYVSNTGHALAALTRTDGSGPAPAVADLVGDGLIVRGIVSATAVPWLALPDMFLVPAASLALQDVAIDPTTGPSLLTPRNYGLTPVPGTAPASPSPAPPTLAPLGFYQPPPSHMPTVPLPSTANGLVLASYTTAGALSLTLDPSLAALEGLQYYVVVASQVTDPNETPSILDFFQGPITVTTPISRQTATPRDPLYSVLVLLQTMVPCVIQVKPS